MYIATHGLLVDSNMNVVEDIGNVPDGATTAVLAPDCAPVLVRAIAAKLARTRAKTVVLFLDVCNAGGNNVLLHAFQQSGKNVAVIGCVAQGAFMRGTFEWMVVYVCSRSVSYTHLTLPTKRIV